MLPIAMLLLIASAPALTGCGQSVAAGAVSPDGAAESEPLTPSHEVAAEPAQRLVTPPAVLPPLELPPLDGLDAAVGSVQHGSSLPKRQPKVEPLPEVWSGVYSRYPSIVGVRISITDSDVVASHRGTRQRKSLTMAEKVHAVLGDRPASAVPLKGKAVFYRLRDPRKSSHAAQPDNDLTEIAACGVIGWRDPALGVVALKSGAWEWASTPLSDRTELGLAMVQAPAGKRLGGWLAMDARGEAFPITLSSDVRDAAGLVRRAIDDTGKGSNEPHQWIQSRMLKGGSRRQPYRQGPYAYQSEVDALVHLAKRFREEIDPKTLERWRIGDHSQHAMNLIGEPFEEIMGVAYEDLTQADRTRWSYALNEVRQGQHGERAAYDTKPLGGFRLFASGCPGWKMTLAELWTHQAAVGWQRTQLERFNDGVVDQQSWADLQLLGRTAGRLVRGLTPTAREGLDEQLVQARSRVAARTLAARRTIDLESPEDAELMKFASKTEAGRKAIGRIGSNDRVERLAELRGEAERFAETPDGEDAFVLSNKFRVRVINEFRDLASTDTHQAVVAYIDARRRRLVDARRDHLLARYAAATTSDELDAASRGVLVTDQERGSPAGQELMAARATHRARVERTARLAYFSDQEQAWMRPGTTEIVIPEEIPEPTADSIRHAWLREVADLPACERVNPDTVSYSAPGFKLMRMTYNIRVRSARKAMNRQGETAEDAGDGFRCYYRLDFKMIPTGTAAELLTYRGPQATWLKGLVNAGNQSSGTRTHADEYVLTSGGWRSPTARRRGYESQAAIYQTLGEAAQQSADAMLDAPMMLPGARSGYRVRRFRRGRKVFTRYERY